MSFKEIFASDFLVSITSPGRVNLLGEHTDYNNGLVLPMVIDKYTTISMAINPAREENTFRAYSHNELSDGIVERSIEEEKRNHWSDYVIAMFWSIQKYFSKTYQSFDFPALDIYIESNIPLGAGLSSSASLLVGLGKAIRELYESVEIVPFDDTSISEYLTDLQIAKLAKIAENEYIGLPCGFMDQMVISLGAPHTAMCIDFYDGNNPTQKSSKIFDTHYFLVISSGISHKLTDSEDQGYATRVAQCTAASDILEVPHLSALGIEDIDSIKSKGVLDDIKMRRVAHIVNENNRVSHAFEALVQKDVKTFGTLMIESHNSQRDLYNVSIPEIDAMVDSALKLGAVGARLTGGGFGGSIVVLVKNDLVEKFTTEFCALHKNATVLT